jgi:hypothetical protein
MHVHGFNFGATLVCQRLDLANHTNTSLQVSLRQRVHRRGRGNVKLCRHILSWACRHINSPGLSALKIARKLLIYDFSIGGLEEEPSFARKTLDQSPISDF